MTKRTLIAITIFLIILGVVCVRFLSGQEDGWLCKEGLWVKHGHPKTPMPSVFCSQSQIIEKVKVFSPSNNEQLRGDFKVFGEAVGGWFFEGGFPIKLVDENGTELSSCRAMAEGDYMTENYVKFSCQMEAFSNKNARAMLIFSKDNPSDIAENDEKIEIPVIIAGSDFNKIKLYFVKSGQEEQNDCSKVFPIEKNILKSKTPARDAIEKLLKGPSDKDKQDGFSTLINPEVFINTLIIKNEVAKIDFNEKLEEGVAGSCNVLGIRAQITETLKQFFSVKEVIISINGKTEGILQP